ncbi:MAG: nuclear transport factor 2 family protein [Myxococcota bacterium]
MDLAARYLTYAFDFERVLHDGDWSQLEQYFTDDAVFEVRNAWFACRLEGKDAVLRGIRKSVEGFDLQCADRRAAARRGPVLVGDQVEFDWTVTYSVDGAPDFILVGGSVATFAGDKIVHLYDWYPDGMSEATIEWGRAHAPTLSAAYV